MFSAICVAAALAVAAPLQLNTADCVESAARIVDDVYKQVLERPADPASAPLTQALADGRTTVREIVAQVAKSPEHADRFYWHPMAKALYSRIMAGEPSPYELGDITSDLKARRKQLPEVIAGIAGRAESNPEDAVRILYRGLLRREPDPRGLQENTELARREGLDAVARAMAASPEYRRRTTRTGVVTEDLEAIQTAVKSLYQHVLGRDPDPRGLSDLTQIAALRGFEAVVDRMVQSQEYERLYGSNVVPGSGARYCGSTR